MSRSPVTVVPSTPVLEARDLMARHRIRHLLVVDGSRLVGIVTDRDIRLNLPSPATSLSVWEIIVVEPERDARDAARIMLDHKIGALPVVSGERLVGIVTESDFLRAFVAGAIAAPAAVPS